MKNLARLKLKPFNEYFKHPTFKIIFMLTSFSENILYYSIFAVLSRKVMKTDSVDDFNTSKYSPLSQLKVNGIDGRK